MKKRSKNRTFLDVSSSLIKYLGDQPLMRVVAGLVSSTSPRHIRELSFQYSLSPAGVSDIIRRLRELGLLKEFKEKNKKCFVLNLEEHERRCLQRFFSIYQIENLKERAKRYSTKAKTRFKWMDEAHSTYRKIKKITK